MHVRWEEIMAALIRRRRTVVLTVLAALVVAVVTVASRPPTYEASARVVVRFDVAESELTLGERERVRYVDALEQRINNVFAMLTSRSLVRDVLRSDDAPVLGDSKRVDSAADETRLGLMIARAKGTVERVMPILERVSDSAGYPRELYRELHGVPAADEIDVAANAALSRLKVRRVEDSDVLRVSYSGEDPAWAAWFVNTLVARYTREADNVMERDTALSFFHSQRERLAAQRGSAQADLAAFREGHGSDLTPADDRALRAERERLASSLARMRSELAGVDASVASLESERARITHGGFHDSDVELSDPVEQLKSQLAELEVERAELLSRYLPTSAIVGDYDSRIARVKVLLSQERGRLSRSLAASGPGVQRIDLDLVAERARRAELSATVAALESEIANYDQRVRSIERLAAEQKRLQTELDIAEEAYSSYMRKEEEARFSIALHESNITNVSVIEWADAPTTPVSSAAGVKLAVVGLMGLVVGLGLAFVQDRADPLLLSASEAESVSGMPLVAVLAGGVGDVAAPMPGGGSRRFSLLLFATIVATGALLPLRLATDRQAAPEPSTPDTVAAVDVASDAGRAQELDVPQSRPVRARAKTSAAAQPPVLASISVPSVLLGSNRRKPARGALQVISPLAVADEGDAAAPAVEAEAADDGPRVLTIERGATMYSMIRSAYGYYDPHLLSVVRRANPWLADPARLPVGQSIHLPRRREL